MASFKIDNGKTGPGHCHHTATGYECGARLLANKDYSERVMFFARHVVGGDGYPYTEIGLTGLEEQEKDIAMTQLKHRLKEHSFTEVLCLREAHNIEFAFVEHIIPEHDGVAIRVNAGEQGISIIVDVLTGLIDEAARRFIKEQEKVDDVLFHSILNIMGPDLDKGPGGHDQAVEKAHQLADDLLHGFAANDDLCASGSTALH